MLLNFEHGRFVRLHFLVGLETVFLRGSEVLGGQWDALGQLPLVKNRDYGIIMILDRNGHMLPLLDDGGTNH